MRRSILSAYGALIVLLMVSGFTTQLTAFSHGYGPEEEWKIPTSNPQAALTCPDMITVNSCEEGIYTTFAEFEAAGGGFIGLPEECVVDSFAMIEQELINTSGCTYIYLRTYYVSETCGNEYTCYQPVVFEDTTPPTIISCPDNVTLNVDPITCTATTVLDGLDFTNECDIATATNDAPATYPLGDTEVTFTVSDACGNSTTCSAIVTVVDTSSLTVMCPSDTTNYETCDPSTILPYATIELFLAAGGSVDGNCSSESMSLTLSSTDEVQAGECPAVIERTYVVTDQNGNTGSCTQLVIASDTLPPMFAVPQNVTVDCGLESDTTLTGVPSMVNDNCDANPSITFEDEIGLGNGCPEIATITRAWIVADACNNADTQYQTIITIDTIAPIAMCVDTVFAYLNAVGDATVNPEMIDNGSFDACTDVELFTSSTFISCNQLTTSMEMEIDLIVIDSCGNESTCNSQLVILDTLAVDLISPPNDTFQCLADVDPAFDNFSDYELIGGGSVEDNCVSQATFYLQSADTTGLCPQVITRVYYYEDLSGNNDTASHTIIVNDTIAPTIVACPADISISEMDICDTLLVFGAPEVSDNCGEVTITNNYTLDEDTSAIFEGGSYVITFTATDACGNAATCQTSIYVASEPRITFPPLPTIDNESDLPEYETLDDFLAAGGMVNQFCTFDDTTFVYEVDLEIGDNCMIQVEENVTIADTSGLVYTEVNSTLVMDTIAPEFLGCNIPVFRVLNSQTCMYDMTLDTPIITDNFGIDTVYAVVGENVNDTVYVDWFAIDNCQNIDSCTQSYIILDTTTPDFGINDTIIECDPANLSPYTNLDDFLTGSGAYVFDCRTDSMSFMFLGDSLTPQGTIIREYFIADLQGNTNVTQQIISSIDSIPPSISCEASISEVADVDTCGTDVLVPQPDITDNCDPDVDYYNTYNLTQDASDFYPVGVTEVLWIATDSSGLSDTCVTTITVTDETIPMVSCPVDTIIECQIDVYPPYTSLSEFIAAGGSVSDNCLKDTIAYSTVLTPLANVYQREYIVFDESGNTNSCIQEITVSDTEAPTFLNCPDIIVASAILDCFAEITITTPQVTDNCTGPITITNSINGSGDPSGNFAVGMDTIQWIAEDAYGNTDTCYYYINVIDGASPNVVAPDTSYIMCEEMIVMIDTFTSVSDVENYGGTVTDNCAIDTIMFISQVEVGADTIKRTYEAVDPSNSTTTFCHFIVIEDTTAPEFDAPQDVVIDCSLDENDLGLTGMVSMTSDNCMEIDTLIYEDTVFEASCPYKDSIQRVWTLSDINGNIAVDTQWITTIDTTPAVFDSNPMPVADIACNEALPTPEELTSTDACGTSTVVFEVLPYTPDACSDVLITYQWVSFDECNNSDTISTSFLQLADATPPSLVSMEDITVSTSFDTCGIYVDMLDAPIFEEDCSTVSSVVLNMTSDVLPTGINEVMWTATNNCGLDTTVTQNVTVVDSVPPFIQCDSYTLGINTEGFVNLSADLFVQTVSDNCGVADVGIIRMEDPCGYAGNLVYSDSIQVCCADVNDTVVVQLRVTDINGNENFCMTSVLVTDKRAPQINQYLPDITVSCEYFIDTSDLTGFGEYVMLPEDQEDIIVEDTFYVLTDSIAGEDGLVTDECDFTISEVVTVIEDACGQDTIVRDFIFTDAQGQISTAQQRIYIQDVMPFNEDGNDIIWPAAFTWSQCVNPAPDTSIAGAPVILNEDKCSQVAMSYKDLVFDFPATSCPYIRRQWKVIDWCQYDNTQDPNPGLWTYNQDIYISNGNAPTILSSCADTTICAPNNSCSGIVNLSIEAEDDCDADPLAMYYEYQIDEDNDGDIDLVGYNYEFTRLYGQGTHKVYWIVEDRCGNVSTCEYLFTVVECKAPTPVCHDGLVINISNGDPVELWASDVNSGSYDNCTAQNDLLLSFSSDTNETSVAFDCDDVGTNQYVELWVTDEAGNQSFCSTFVEIQDNGGSCNNTIVEDEMIPLLGRVVSPSGKAIPEAKVSIIGAEMIADNMTDDEGNYSLGEINTKNEYQVDVDRDYPCNEGVSTLDLVMIQRHILGLNTFTSTYQLIAADVNNSESISASDLLALRKVILGIDDCFTQNLSWRFITMNEEMDASNPWPLQEDLMLYNVDYDNLNTDFTGVKIGDVNNSVDDLLEYGSSVRNNASYVITSYDRPVNRNDQVFVDFKSEADLDLVGLQMTISWDTDAMHFIDFIPIGLFIEDAEVNKEHIAEGYITIAWSSSEAKDVFETTTLFQIILEANESGRLSELMDVNSTVTSAKAYDDDYKEYDVEWIMSDGIKSNMALLQNQPNPFSAQTNVNFSIPEAMDVTFKVFDNNGRLIYDNTNYYQEGENVLTLSEELNGYSGIMYIKMETAEFTAGRKMIKIE